MIDWDAHYDSIYSVLGVTAELTPRDSSDSVEIVAIDKTAGILIETDVSAIPTTKPAATIRAAELARLEIEMSWLRGGFLEINGGTWRIFSVQHRTGPNGRGSGEYLLILEDGAR